VSSCGLIHLMPVLEELHGPLMLLSLFHGAERAEVPPPAGLRVDFAGIEPILARFQFANHDAPPGGKTSFTALNQQVANNVPRLSHDLAASPDETTKLRH